MLFCHYITWNLHNLTWRALENRVQWQNKSWKNNFKSHCTYYLQPLLLKHSRLFFLLKRKSCGREEGIWNDSHIWHVLNNFNTKESMNFEFLSRQKFFIWPGVSNLFTWPNTQTLKARTWFVWCSDFLSNPLFAKLLITLKRYVV